MPPFFRYLRKISGGGGEVAHPCTGEGNKHVIALETLFLRSVIRFDLRSIV